jgi:hypothetical protein
MILFYLVPCPQPRWTTPREIRKPESVVVSITIHLGLQFGPPNGNRPCSTPLSPLDVERLSKMLCRTGLCQMSGCLSCPELGNSVACRNPPRSPAPRRFGAVAPANFPASPDLRKNVGVWHVKDWGRGMMRYLLGMGFGH